MHSLLPVWGGHCLLRRGEGLGAGGGGNGNGGDGVGGCGEGGGGGGNGGLGDGGGNGTGGRGGQLNSCFHVSSSFMLFWKVSVFSRSDHKSDAVSI